MKRSLEEIFSILPKSFISRILNEFSEKRSTLCYRLELLGDKVIGLSVCEYLMCLENEFDEGLLTKRISYLASRDTFKNILFDLIYDLPNDWSTKRYADLFETLIGMSYQLDSSWVNNFLICIWNKYYPLYEERRFNPKGELQEWTMKEEGTKNIYINKKINGYFIVLLTVSKLGRFCSTSGNLKNAEKIAAFKALKRINL